jgi:hypothetical protein
MATDIKFVYIATGFDEDAPSTFTILATRHANWMVRRLNAKKGKPDSPLTLPAVVRFVHFDWQNDRILVYEHPFPEKGSKPPRPLWKELSAFTSTEGEMTDHPKSFIAKSATVGLNRVGISIVDIYRAVRKSPRGKVLDVSIYSHGFIDGPVLENTGDSQLTAPTGEPIRTNSDLDGRVRSDFTPHMGEQNPVTHKDALKEFREGFASDATFRVFGCHVQDIVDGTAFGESSRSLLRSTAFEVIRAAYIVQIKKKTAAGRELRKPRKPASVTLDMGHEFAIEDEKNDTSHSLTNFDAGQLKVLHYGLDPSFFPDKNTGPLTFNKPFTDVTKFIARQTKLGYVFKAAEALPAVTCLGAVPGSGGDFETGGNRLMFVPKKDWGLILMFFKNFMGITLDERNYGRFDAAGVASINERELNG